MLVKIVIFLKGAVSISIMIILNVLFLNPERYLMVESIMNRLLLGMR